MEVLICHQKAHRLNKIQTLIQQIIDILFWNKLRIADVEGQQVTFVQMKAPTFLVREKGFDTETLAIPIEGFFSQFEIRDQILTVRVNLKRVSGTIYRALSELCPYIDS